MLVRQLTLLLISATQCRCWHRQRELEPAHHATPRPAAFRSGPALSDAEHRGPRWYNMDSSSEPASDLEVTDDTSSLSVSSEALETESTGASSIETDEQKLVVRSYRACVACRADLIKGYANVGIQWVCGAYQRARRSFKSECMMRYRNCQDGTMFVQIHGGRCRNDTFHGRHWFYVYRL